jgi:hypothetical protein
VSKRLKERETLGVYKGGRTSVFWGQIREKSEKERSKEKGKREIPP